MLDNGTLDTLRDAMDGLEHDPWSALPALARLNAAGQRLVIDYASSEKLGTPVVILRPALTAPPGLTPRQNDIAKAIARGLSNAEIAREQGITIATVKDHVHAILTRLSLSRRTEIAAACHGHDPKASAPDP